MRKPEAEERQYDFGLWRLAPFHWLGKLVPRHPLNPTVLYTDGTKHVADVVGAYWLIDEIALAQRYERAVRAEAFQVWRLDVKDSAARLTCEDGNEHIVHAKAIQFTDFPEPGITLWYSNNTILLPSEY